MSGKMEFLAYVVLYFLLTMPYLVFSIPIITLICSYSSTILLTFIYAGSLKKRILSGTLSYIIMVMSECIVAVFSGYVDFDIFQKADYYSIFGTICLPLAQFLIVLLVRNFKNISEGEHVPASYWVICVTLPLFSLFLFSLFYNQTSLKAVDLLCSTCILFMINVFVFYLYDHQIEAFRIKQEKETLELQSQYQSKQLELMNQTVEQSREQRHDFLRHISMISYMIEQGEGKRLSDYLEEIQGNMAKKQQYVDTGNFVLDGILNYKIQEAVASEIRVEAEVKVPAELELSVYDMNIILTNLLDNSIEAVKNIEDKRVQVYIMYSKSRLQIKIRNPFEGERIKEKGNYITTKADKTKHGYGLKNIEKIVKKYDGIFEVREEEGEFIAEVILLFGALNM
ncbi:MAG: GHKL domain-containing protein [Roseburia sp.]|nr:GHKL domain-containing protein [Roseburia sp.]